MTTQTPAHIEAGNLRSVAIQASARVRQVSSAVCLGACLTLLTACNPEARGFALPPGDAAAGRATFVDLGCNRCHSVADIPHKPAVGDPPVHVHLGGTVTRVKTYGELVTSIIHPTHEIVSGHPEGSVTTAEGVSKMPVFNDRMTVEQLVNLVTFLQSEYDIWIPEYYPGPLI